MSNSEELPVQRRRRRRLHMREERRSYNTRTENNTNTENHRRRLTESSSEDEQKERPRPIPPRRRRKAIRIMRRTVIVAKSPMRMSNETQVRDEKVKNCFTVSDEYKKEYLEIRSKRDIKKRKRNTNIRLSELESDQNRPEEKKKKTVSSSLLSQENGFLKFNEEQIKLFRQNRTQQRKLDHVTLKLKKNLGKTIEQLEQANENLLDIFQRAEWKITQYEFELTTKSPLRWYQVNKKKKEKSNMVEYKRLIDLKVEAVRLSDVIVSEIRLLKEQNRSLSNKKS